MVNVEILVIKCCSSEFLKLLRDSSSYWLFYYSQRYYEKGAKNQIVLDEVKYSGEKEITCIEAIDISTDIESGYVEIANRNGGGIGKTSVRLFVQSAMISGGYDFQIVIFGKN